MSDSQSFRVRSREGSVSSSIAAEAQRIVRDAAQPVPPGHTVKGQLRRAARALGYCDGDWRIRAAWYGEADSWSARAFEDLRARYAIWRARQSARAESESEKAAAVFAALARRLEATDAEFHWDDIAALFDLVRALRAQTNGK